MQILYFAWLKTRLGCAEETLTPPPEVQTVADLAAWLAQRSPAYGAVFGDSLSMLKAAVDQEHVSFEHPLAGAAEVAFFPPVTGG
jgi:molybdopterin synthase sulfur carrier subunit